MDAKILKTFEESLGRCNANPAFLDRFYEIFLVSSPKIKEKFAHTDFVHQKRALRASLYTMLLALEDEEKGPEKYLHDIAERHSSRDLGIGAELYDLWLDSLLATVREIDPGHSPEVEEAWERVMMVGIHCMLAHY